jgi:hypothetical protein
LSAGLQVREVLSLLACGDQWVNFALHALIWLKPSAPPALRPAAG